MTQCNLLMHSSGFGDHVGGTHCCMVSTSPPPLALTLLAVLRSLRGVLSNFCEVLPLQLEVRLDVYSVCLCCSALTVCCPSNTRIGSGLCNMTNIPAITHVDFRCREYFSDTKKQSVRHAAILGHHKYADKSPMPRQSSDMVAVQ